MTDAVATLDAAILDHLRQHPKAHPMSSPEICKLAALTATGRLPYRIIEARMRVLRLAGSYVWCKSRQRYVVEGC